jgi:hypothetical protein
MAKPPLTIAHQRTPPTKALISTNRTPLGGINFSKVASPWHGAFATQNGNPSTLLPKNYQRLYSDTTSTNPLTLSYSAGTTSFEYGSHMWTAHIFVISTKSTSAQSATSSHTISLVGTLPPINTLSLSFLDSAFACSSPCLGRSSGS